MNEDLLLLIVFAGFIVLQRWILPRFGINTCLSPKGCKVKKDIDNSNS